MSSNDFILTWLNSDLNFTPKISNITKEFSNGYNFAKILFILNELSEDQFNEFKDTNNIEEIKTNFRKLQKYFHDKLNLDIREDEFNELMNKDVSKGNIILYKIKNSLHKKKINFLEIKTSDVKPTKEEMDNKIKELMRSTVEEEGEIKEIKEKEEESSRKMVYNKATIRKMFDGKSNLNPIESISSGLNKKNIKIKLQKIDSFTNTSKPILNDKEDNSGYNNFKTMENDNLKKKKLTKNFLPKIKLNSLGKKNISNLKYNFKLFNAEEKEINNFYNDYGMMKLNELKIKLKAKENMKKEINKEILSINKNKDFEIKEKYCIDFIKRANNPFYKSSKSTGINLSSNIYSKYNSYTKRTEYAKEFSEIKRKNELNNQILNIRKLMNKNKYLEPLSPRNKHVKFNAKDFLNEIDQINIDEYNTKKQERYSHIKNIYPDINNLVYSIIDLTEDIYQNQIENEQEVLNLDDYHKFFELFINNKQVKKVIKIKKEDSIDNINNIQKLEPKNIVLKDDEKFLIQDYINYIGIWNDKKIINLDEKTIKFDIKKIKLNIPLDYEPTKNEIDDITIPNKLYDNYLLGNTLINLIDNKFNLNANNNKENIDLNKDFNKWDYIPYKISLIGYPLSGRKLLGEKLIKIYPNLKVYSIKKIFREYYIQYKEITEIVEGNPKYQNLKQNQIEQIKEEKNKKLEEFQPIINILRPFIDIINSEKNKKHENRIINLNEINNNENSPKNFGSPKKKRKPSVSRDKKSMKSSAAGSPRKKNIDKNNESIEENFSEDLKIIPNDEVLFNLLKYLIEKDFPQKSKEDLEKEIIELKNKEYNLLKEKENYEKIKSESNKPNPKNDGQITNLLKDLENIKKSSIKGFILTDYPSNINQGILLENYLTGYEDELQKPKTEKSIILNNISNFLDYKIIPKENISLKKSGLDFIINIKIKEKDIEERFKSIKYDPVSDTIYTYYELSEDNNNKNNIDKKVIERLIDEVPYLTKENFEFYKDEYRNNIGKIKTMYDKFGMWVNIETKMDEEIDINFNEKIIKKSYQQIEFDSFKNDTRKIYSENKDIKINSPKKNNNNNENKSEIDNIYSIDDKNMNKALNYISNDIIDILYKEKDKLDKNIFYSKNPEFNQEEKSRIKFELIDEKKKKISRGQSTFSSKNINDLLFLKSLTYNIDYFLKNISEFNIKYNQQIGKFIFFLNIQRNKIYQKLNNYQTYFRDYLNHKTTKKKLINMYISKYNEFFEKNNYFENTKVIKEFNNDIEEMTNSLWLLIYEKEKNSIQELNNIKNDGFMLKELEKFYFNIKELFLIETEKFILMINSILYLYFYENKNLSKNQNNKNIIDINELNNKYDKNEIFNDILPITFNDKNNIEKNIKKIISNIDILFTNIMKLIFSYEDVISKLIEEIKYALMLSTKKSVKKSIKSNTSSSSLAPGLSPQDKLIKILYNEKNKFKYRILFLQNFTKKYMTIMHQTSQNIYNNLDQWIITSVTLQNDALNSVVSILRKNLEEHKLIDENNEIHNIEMDDFEKKLEGNDDEKSDEIGIVKPIDNNSICGGRVYNKINIDYLIKDEIMDIKVEEIEIKKNENNEKNNNANENKVYKLILLNELDEINSSFGSIKNSRFKESDFFFDLNKFNDIYLKIKKYEIEPNIINKDTFYQIFIKQYLIDKYDENKIEENEKDNKIEKIINRNYKKKKTKSREILTKKEEEENSLNEKLITNQSQNIITNLNGICSALKQLNTKQQSKLYSLYKLEIEHKNDNLEYEIYLNTNEIFTILSLIGCKVLNTLEEENISKSLKEKLISGKYISKNDFMEYSFWFEKDLEYQNNIFKYEESLRKKSKKIVKDNKMNINIKEFIFNLWKDESGNKMDFEKFMSILKMNRYITDINAFKEDNYYNIIFEK